MSLQKPWKQGESGVKYLKCLEGKKIQQSRTLYPEKLSFKSEEVNTNTDKNWGNMLPAGLSYKKILK